MKIVVKTTACLILLTALSSPALADPADDAIDARRGYFQVVKFNAAPLISMAKGEMDYDAKKSQAYADNLQALAKMSTGAMYPPGSDSTAKKGKTRALPAIWSSYPAIAEKSKAWKTAVKELSGTAGGGLDMLRSKIGALGASCKGCHDNYRAKDF